MRKMPRNYTLLKDNTSYIVEVPPRNHRDILADYTPESKAAALAVMNKIKKDPEWGSVFHMGMRGLCVTNSKNYRGAEVSFFLGDYYRGASDFLLKIQDIGNDNLLFQLSQTKERAWDTTLRTEVVWFKDVPQATISVVHLIKERTPKKYRPG